MTQDQGPEDDRFERGQRLLSRIHGPGGEAVMRRLVETAPDLARYVVEFAYGDVHSRPGLALRERQVATIAALAALGATPQLKVHVEAGLKVGLTRDEIVEIIMQMAVYAGFPAALNALAAATEAFAALDERDAAAAP